MTIISLMMRSFLGCCSKFICLIATSCLLWLYAVKTPPEALEDNGNSNVRKNVTKHERRQNNPPLPDLGQVAVHFVRVLVTDNRLESLHHVVRRHRFRSPPLIRCRHGDLLHLRHLSLGFPRATRFRRRYDDCGRFGCSDRNSSFRRIDTARRQTRRAGARGARRRGGLGGTGRRSRRRSRNGGSLSGRNSLVGRQSLLVRGAGSVELFVGLRALRDRCCVLGRRGGS